MSILPDKLKLKEFNDICLVENTTNILISPLQLNDKQERVVTVVCDSDENSGFSFFNVTNLTIKSVHFIACGSETIPQPATKYINESRQFFYYSNIQTIFLFNHCSNLTLHNVLGESNTVNVKYRASIIGVNLCGWSNITALDHSVPFLPTRLLTLVIYYVDSIMMNSSECQLYIKSNILSGNKYIDITNDLHDNVERMPVYPVRDFSFYLAQQAFQVVANIFLDPMLCVDGDSGNSHAIIMFVNNVYNSHIIIQGYPLDICFNDLYFPARSLQLDIIFYETTFSGSRGNKRNSLTIKKTAFTYYGYDTTHDHGDILRIMQFSKTLSHQVSLETIAWCSNSIYHFYDFAYFRLLYASNYRLSKLYLKTKNIYAHNNYGYWLFPSTNQLWESYIL